MASGVASFAKEGQQEGMRNGLLEFASFILFYFFKEVEQRLATTRQKALCISSLHIYPALSVSTWIPIYCSLSIAQFFSFWKPQHFSNGVAIHGILHYPRVHLAN